MWGQAWLRGAKGGAQPAGGAGDREAGTGGKRQGRHRHRQAGSRWVSGRGARGTDIGGQRQDGTRMGG